MKLVLLFVAIASGLTFAQGTKTRDDASKYSSHAEMGSLSLGADFWGHYIPIENSSIKTDGYLVVEVALFAPPSAKVEIRPDQFVLMADGQRLLAQPASMVTIGSVIPDMRERGPRVEADANLGGVTASAGKDPAQPKFPGDTNPADAPPMRLPGNQDENLQKPALDVVKVVADEALPAGSKATPVSGYLYFAWSGKLKKLKHAQLEYKGPSGTATLTLR